MKMRLLCCFLFLSCFPSKLVAETYYVDPAADFSLFSDGSMEKPWNDLEDVLEDQEKNGVNEIILLPGLYGTLNLKNVQFRERITLRSQVKHKAKFSHIKLGNVENLILEDLAVSSSFGTSKNIKTMVRVSGGSRNITIKGFDIFSAANIEGWQKNTWKSNAVNGIEVAGEKISLLDNNVRNVRFGINVLADHSTVKGNTVANFSGDGMRGLGDYILFEKNTIKNCFQVDRNHPDGFQSWSVGEDRKVAKGIVRGNILRGNIILNYEDKEQPFKCQMHGIGMFGGMYVDWIIENNIVVSDHWHGITVMGAKNVRVLNNTVIDPDPGKPGPAWIKIMEHRDGRVSSGNFVANNLANIFKSSKTGVLQVNNVRVKNLRDHFVNPDNMDFRLLPDSVAIDAGMNDVGSNLDFLGQKRLNGSRVDAGAIEFYE